VNRKPNIVAPSVLAWDYTKIGEECLLMERAGADWLHLDIMDGHFVPNLSFGPGMADAISKVARLPIDTHLMLERPDLFVPMFLPASASITIHIEAEVEVGTVLNEIRSGGARNGLAIKPNTDFALVEPFLTDIDLLLVMTVYPGFGGQPFLPETMDHVRKASAFRAAHGLDFHIQVDGGIDLATSAIARDAGANVFVAGTALFRAGDFANAIQGIRG
jgi:ribulose-phosphate 3-epimerase